MAFRGKATHSPAPKKNSFAGLFEEKDAITLSGGIVKLKPTFLSARVWFLCSLCEKIQKITWTIVDSSIRVTSVQFAHRLARVEHLLERIPRSARLSSKRLQFTKFHFARRATRQRRKEIALEAARRMRKSNGMKKSINIRKPLENELVKETPLCKKNAVFREERQRAVTSHHKFEKRF